MHNRLTDVVGAEGGCKRHAVQFGEGVVLHRADERDGNVSEPIGSAFGDKRHARKSDKFERGDDEVPIDLFEARGDYR